MKIFEILSDKKFVLRPFKLLKNGQFYLQNEKKIKSGEYCLNDWEFMSYFQDFREQEISVLS